MAVAVVSRGATVQGRHITLTLLSTVSLIHTTSTSSFGEGVSVQHNLVPFRITLITAFSPHHRPHPSPAVLTHFVRW